jgi:chromosome segregation ATPase
MARGRVYKSEVKAARDALLVQGTNPSLDAIRVALGNTGSKTTIHRLLREIEAEEDHSEATCARRVSETLLALVTQLTNQLQREAEQTVATGKEHADAAVAAARGEVATASQQVLASNKQVQRLESDLAASRTACSAAEEIVRTLDRTIVGLQERVAGLERQLQDRDTHLASVEAKHDQARDALAHFRQASKEQRDNEARQHEQAVQALQVELRRATDAVAVKNDELLTLNRDNARLTEQAGIHEKELRGLRRDLERAYAQAAEADTSRQRSAELEQRVAHLTAALATAQEDLAGVEARSAAERSANDAAMRGALTQNERLQAIEAMLSSLQQSPRIATGDNRDKATGEVASD